MLGKWMNNFYYGKAGKGDFEKSDLPKNRKQLFWEMLRVRFSALARLNMISVICWLPLLYVLAQWGSRVISLMSFVAQAANDPTALSPDQLAVAQNANQALYDLCFMSFLWMIPAIAITGPAQAGMAYVTRNWSRDEHAFAWGDFKDAVKENWKQALLVSSISSVLPLVLLVCVQFYGNLGENNFIFVVPQMLCISLGVIWYLALVFFYPLMVSYKLSLKQLFQNALLLAVGRLPQTLGVRLLTLVPALLALLTAYFTPYWMYAFMVLAGYYLFFGLSFSRFVYASFSNGVFDRYINANIAGAPVNRGLSTEIDEDDEDEDESDGGKEARP